MLAIAALRDVLYYYFSMRAFPITPVAEVEVVQMVGIILAKVRRPFVRGYESASGGFFDGGTQRGHRQVAVV
jgi:hypothetical protein